MNKARSTVIRRGDRFTVVLDLGRDEAGKRVRRWHAGYETATDAEKARTELLSSLDRQEYVAPSKVTVKTFTEERWLPALDGLVASGKLNASTVGNYHNLALAYVVPKLGRIVLRDLTADQLGRFYGTLLVSGRRQGKSGSRSARPPCITSTSAFTECSKMRCGGGPSPGTSPTWRARTPPALSGGR